MLEFLKAPFLALHFSYYAYVILLSMLTILLSTLYTLYVWSGIRSVATTSVCFWTWIWPTRHCRPGKWLVDFIAGKTQLVSFDWSNNSGAIDVKMDGSFSEGKPSFKMVRLSFSSKWDWGSYIISIAKTASKKIEALIRSMKFLSSEVGLYLLLCGLSLNTV